MTEKMSMTEGSGKGGKDASSSGLQQQPQNKAVKTSDSTSSNGTSTNGSSGGGGTTTAVSEQPPQQRNVRKELTEEDMLRYRNYVGQKWTGKCKWFNVSKGFGFVIPDHEEAKAHEDDVFVHQSALQMEGFRSLDEGEEIEFTVQLGKRGLEAEQVTGINGASIRGHSIRPVGKKRDIREKLIRCYNCGQLGRHKASKCKKQLAPAVTGEQDPAGQKPAPTKVCYHCHSTEHLLAQCPDYANYKATKAAASEQKYGGRGGGARRYITGKPKQGGNGGGGSGGQKQPPKAAAVKQEPA